MQNIIQYFFLQSSVIIFRGSLFIYCHKRFVLSLLDAPRQNLILVLCLQHYSMSLCLNHLSHCMIQKFISTINVAFYYMYVLITRPLLFYLVPSAWTEHWRSSEEVMVHSRIKSRWWWSLFRESNLVLFVLWKAINKSLSIFRWMACR